MVNPRDLVSKGRCAKLEMRGKAKVRLEVAMPAARCDDGRARGGQNNSAIVWDVAAGEPPAGLRFVNMPRP
jgi:hypothetical protein